MTDLTPREIVSELDRFIIGQADAKRAVAVALRNRWRRKQLDEDLQDEVYPKNILMIGPTGVGKTEISRRLAKLARAPFLKVEATKFTEVGYVGRDVDQIVRDLVDAAILMTREHMRETVKANAHTAAEDRVIEALAGEDARSGTRDMFRKKLRSGELDDKIIELDVADNSNPMQGFEIPGQPGASMGGMMNLGDIFGKAFGQRTTRKKMTVAQSYEVLIDEEADKLLDQEVVAREALCAVENNGIVFLDEIDKVCARTDARGGDVSREGVQRDLLPLIEGTTVSTKHGAVKTDHILFIASGAFHIAKPSDLLPELQGRPIAAMDPRNIEITASSARICCQSPTAPPNASCTTRANSPIAATLGAVAKNAVTGVGDPSYTSGVHMWNGAADTLNARPAIRKTRPISKPIGICPSIAVAASMMPA